MEIEKNIKLANQATAKSITTTNLNEALVSNDTSSTDTDSRRRLARRLADDGGDDDLSALRAENLANLDFTSMSKVINFFHVKFLLNWAVLAATPRN